jgi:chromate transport protein ChrA
MASRSALPYALVATTLPPILYAFFLTWKSSRAEGYRLGEEAWCFVLAAVGLAIWLAGPTKPLPKLLTGIAYALLMLLTLFAMQQFYFCGPSITCS